MYAREINDMCHYATDEELDWMLEYGKKSTRETRVVMLGVGPGVLLVALKEGNHELIAHGIDLGQFWAMQYLRNAGWEQNVTIEATDSVKAGRRWMGPDIDLLIVDTDHTEQTTLREIEVWMQHVKIGGTIFFHDYDARGTWFENQEQYPGVKAAVDIAMESHRPIGRVGTAIIYEKL